MFGVRVFVVENICLLYLSLQFSVVLVTFESNILLLLVTFVMSGMTIGRTVHEKYYIEQ